MLQDQTGDVVKELVEALIELTPVGKARHPAVAVGLAWLRQHENCTVAQLPGWVKKKACYNCSDEIFFAARRHLKKPGEKVWVPMIPVAVVSDDIILDALSVRFVGTDVWIEDPTPGVQWLPHRVLCGRRDRPLDPVLSNVWEQTAGKAMVEEQTAVEGLLKMLEETT